MRYRAMIVGVLLMLPIVLPESGAAQVVAVRVVDGDNRAPLAGVDVEVRGADSVAVARATTDSTGYVRVDRPAGAAIHLVATRIGYATWRSDRIPASAGESIELEVRLGRDAIPLEPLVVVARATRSARLEGFRRRLAEGGFGSFVTREDIDRRPGAAVSDLLAPLSGVYIVEVSRTGNPDQIARLIGMRGNRTGEVPGAGDAPYCLPGLFLDGVAVRQDPDFPIDDLLFSPSLEGAEVYSSAGSVPIEFQRGGSVACGAVLLWTREAQPGGGRSGWWRWALGLGGFAGIMVLMLK